METEENSLQKWERRNKTVLELLQRFHFLNSKHLEVLIDWNYKVCSRNLKSLVEEQKKVKRWQPHRNTRYIYYLDRKTENMYHWLHLASTYCYLFKTFKIHNFEPEVKFSMMQPDGYTKGVGINTFIEIDRSNTNEFNKVPLYHQLFESDEWLKDYSTLVDGVHKFPSILVVSCRKKAVLNKISKENELGLNFVVMDIDEIEKHLETCPTNDVVGLPNTAVREARERVRAAIKNSRFDFPMQRITVNLAPADIKKEGAVLDFAIALGILSATGQVDDKWIKNTVVLGELSLDGAVRPINGVLSTALKIKKLTQDGASKLLILPALNLHEAALVEGIRIIGISRLMEVNKAPMDKKTSRVSISPSPSKTSLNENRIDFEDVKGQQMAKRALEVAASGGHNILLIGSPGAGKTMLAKRLTTILPEMNIDEALEVTKIYSVAGLLPKEQPLVTIRPFRAPHHTASSVSIIGGGARPKPGEITLAHNGILFLDEFPEFKRDVLEALRQPLEDSSVLITRANFSLDYPANIMLVAAMNPCPCGFLGDNLKECFCTPPQINRYRSRLSGPLLDRIDMHIDVPRLDIDEMTGTEKTETSSTIKNRVLTARRLQLERLKGLQKYTNAKMDHHDVKKYCTLSKEAGLLLRDCYKKLNLSARSYNKILKVARTIADLAGSDQIDTLHAAEALQFRSMDNQSWY